MVVITGHFNKLVSSALLALQEPLSYMYQMGSQTINSDETSIAFSPLEGKLFESRDQSVFTSAYTQCLEW